MKQSELNKMVSACLKREGKTLGWKTKAHNAFRVEGEMFFSLLISGDAKEKTLYRRLSCKPMAFDAELWKILGMTSNLQEPLGFRADGAYTLFGIALYEGSIGVAEWNDEGLLNSTSQCLLEATASVETNQQLRTVDAFMKMGEAFNVDILKRVPNTAWNFWQERLICHRLKGEMEQATSIAEARISAGDSGRFVIGGQTFYQLVQRLPQGHNVSSG
jgi:hypothetical protein